MSFIWRTDRCDWDAYMRNDKKNWENGVLRLSLEARLFFHYIVLPGDVVLPVRSVSCISGTGPARYFAVHILSEPDLPTSWDLVLRSQALCATLYKGHTFVPIFVVDDRSARHDIVFQLYRAFPETFILCTAPAGVRRNQDWDGRLLKDLLSYTSFRKGMDRILVIHTVHPRRQRTWVEAWACLVKGLHKTPDGNVCVRSRGSIVLFYAIAGGRGADRRVVSYPVTSMPKARSTFIVMVTRTDASFLWEWCLYHHTVCGVDRIFLYFQRQLHPWSLYHSMSSWVDEGWLYMSFRQDTNEKHFYTTWSNNFLTTTDWFSFMRLDDMWVGPGFNNRMPAFLDHVEPYDRVVLSRSGDKERSWFHRSPMTTVHANDYNVPFGSAHLSDSSKLGAWVVDRPMRCSILPIYIFYHVGAFHPMGRSIFSEQVKVLRASGLWDRAIEIGVGAVGTFFDSSWVTDNKMRVLYHDPDPTVHELRTMNALRTRMRDCPFPDAWVMYFHTKGVVSLRRYDYRAVTLWRRYLEYQIIGRFERCIRLMQCFALDALGGNFINHHPTDGDPARFRVNPAHTCHYSGNFWWSRASHIRALPGLNITDHRLRAENWVLSRFPDHMRAGECFRYDDMHPYTVCPAVFGCPAEYFRIL